MKNNWFIIDPAISLDETLKRLVNDVFQKEISIDILRGKPPNYLNLYINDIHFSLMFYLHSYDIPYISETGTMIKYLQLTQNVRNSKGYETKKVKSIKIINGKINSKYLRTTFDNIKQWKETNELKYLAKQKVEEEQNVVLSKIKERNKIIFSPTVNLYHNHNFKFTLIFNNLDEDRVDCIMSYWNRINHK